MSKGILAGFAVLVGILGLTWVLTGNEFFLYKYFGPKQEAVRREIFEQSRAFNAGMVRDFENLRMEYMKQTDPDAKAVVADTILHRAAGYDLNDPLVPADLRSFILQLKREHSAVR